MVGQHGELFESDVVPDSGKTGEERLITVGEFESDVVPDSGKTRPRQCLSDLWFESDVVPDGGKIKAGQDGILRIAAEDTDLAPVCSRFAMWICTICTKRERLPYYSQSERSLRERFRKPLLIPSV